MAHRRVRSSRAPRLAEKPLAASVIAFMNWGAKAITIVGGGLAGLTLGIGLRQRGVSTVVIEAGSYPRHRVCGEFISGRGLAVLDGLGLRDRLLEAGARPARSVRFFTPRRASPLCRLPQPALALSRYRLDALLAAEFTRAGGALRTQTRWTTPVFGPGVVRATGRRPRPVEGGRRWFGLRVHARHVSLTADLEMHLTPQGYVGLCQLAGEVVNVCGLFWARPPRAHPTPASPHWLRGEPGSPLHQRLEEAEFLPDSFRSVAGLSLRPRYAREREEVCVGDALTMIPPVTGNGMSLAFESAALAAPSLARFTTGALDWEGVRRQTAENCDTALARRLAWAWWLQRALSHPSLAALVATLVPRVPLLWPVLFARTR